MPHVPLVPDEVLVAGRWRRGGGARTEITEPAGGTALMTLHAASTEDVDEAANAGARAAAATSGEAAWRDLLPHVRARYLHRVADRVEEERERLAALQTADTGKTLSETRALVASAAGTFRYAAALLETGEDALTPSRGPYLSVATHEPIGVVGAIAPWNSPIASDAQKIAPALAAGNAVLLKPADWTPLTSLALARIITESGLPEGLLSVLPGRGRVVGEAIVRHPRVGKVTFTGGTSTGRHIARTAAERLIPASLELGGKSPTVVFADADREQALAGVLYGVFSSSGQSCVAGSRLFVAEEIYEEFLDELVERARKLRVGPGTDPDTQVAPLVHHRHRDAVAEHVDRARSEGARVRCGGRPPSGPEYADGAYYLPTILEGLPNSARACQEEIFGPVLVALPFRDEEDLVEQANDTVYGLACGLWTRDVARAYRVARRIEAGTVWINTYKQFSSATPFSAMKDSGLGSEKGADWLRGYQRQKSLYFGTDQAPLPWAR